MTDSKLAAAIDEIQTLRTEVRDDQAEDIGRNPDDYNSETYSNDLGSDSGETVPDGSE